MADNGEQNNKKYSFDKAKPSKTTELKARYNYSYEPKNTTSTSYTYKIGEHSGKLIGDKKSKKIITTKSVAIIAVFVNIVLAYFTWLLFNTGSSQAKSAISAANIAQKTFEASKRYNDSSLAIQRLTFNSNNIDAKNREVRENERSKRDSISLNAQIQTLQTTQKQFEVGNEPYLQIIDPSFSIMENKHILVAGSLANLGNYPVKVLVHQPGIGFDFAPVTMNVNEYMFKNHKLWPNQNVIINRYMTKDKPININKDNGIQIDKKLENPLRSGDGFLTIEGFIVYQNLVTGTKKIYKYMFKVNIRGVVYTLINENKYTN